MSAAHAPASGPVVAVAVPSPLRSLFDYLVPDSAAPIRPGMRVRVPFGRTSKVGVVLECRAHSEVPAHRLRSVEQVLDDEPMLDPSLLALMRFAVRYFHHPPGDVVATMLPPALRQGAPLPTVQETQWVLTDDGRSVAERDHRLGALQRRLLARLAGAGSCRRPGAPERAALRRLRERGLVREEPVAVSPPGAAQGAPVKLNAEQARAVEQVRASLHGYRAFLLEGVTGSGKTEVYLELIRDVLARGRQALVLIPEIGLTPQIVERFREGLAVPVVAVHSGLARGERLEAWARARSGSSQVVVGTRSAVFAPLAKPGLVVVDEEHDLSYKQQDGLRYSARDLAVLRARQAGVPALLGSASPSLESLHNVRAGRYRRLVLRERAGQGRLPRIEVVDLRGRALRGGLSEPVLEALGECLQAREQALLFVNRRGYAPVLMCRQCGAPVDCTRCDAHMVLHRSEGRLRCHHCARAQPVPARCPCGAEGSLRAIGTGTQRAVEHLHTSFPGVRVARVDRDSTSRRGAMAEVIARVRDHEVDVLVGTQMLAKGHDFPRVTLVAVLDADGGLFSADFRASERMAQLLTQVSGRAGRGELAGRVLVQTHHPGHPLLRTLVTGGYAAFSDAALAERAAAALPPFSHLALMRAEAPERERVQEFLTAARDQAPRDEAVRVLGPVPAPLERRAGRLRAQLLVEADERVALHGFLSRWLPRVESLPAARRVRWSLDVDPQEMI